MGSSGVNGDGAESAARTQSRLVVRIVRTEQQLSKARSIRTLRYRSAELGAEVEQPDAMDYAPNAAVLLTEDRITGLPLATIRIDTGRGEHFYPSDNFDLPTRVKRNASAYLTRLASVPGTTGARATRLTLKAAYRFCIATEMQWMIAFALPPSDRHYKTLGFHTLPEMPDPLPWPSHPERVGTLMVCNLFEVETRWRQEGHRNYSFFFGEHSPEIEIFSSLQPAWHSPRAGGAPSARPDAADDSLDLPLV